MRNKLLITTALVAVSFATNVYAEALPADATNLTTGKYVVEDAGAPVVHDGNVKISQNATLKVETYARNLNMDEDTADWGNMFSINGNLEIGDEKNGGGVLELSRDDDEKVIMSVDGDLTVYDGATVNLKNGVETFATISNTGNVDVKGGTLNLDGGEIFSEGHLTVSGGVINLNEGGMEIGEDINITGGEVNVSGDGMWAGGSMTIGKDATLNITADELPEYGPSDQTVGGEDLINGTNVSADEGISVYGTLNMTNAVLEAGCDIDELPNNSDILLDGATVTMVNSDLEANGDITIKNSRLDVRNNTAEFGIWADKDITVEGSNVDLTRAYISAAGNITLGEGNKIVMNTGVDLNSFVIQTQDGDINVNGGDIDIKNASIEANHGGNININGGTINLEGSDINAWAGKFTMTGGTINMNDKTSEGEHDDLTLWAAKDITLSGGVINMNGEDASIDTLYDLIDADGNLIENPDAPGNIIIDGTTINVNSTSARISTEGKIEVSNSGVINVKEGAVLTSNNAFDEADDDMESYGTAIINLVQGGKINLDGVLNANIDGDDRGEIVFGNANAVVTGNVDTPSLTFMSDHSMSEAITGTLGSVDKLTVAKGTLNFDKEMTSTITTVEVASGATLDIGLNTLHSTGDKADGEGVLFKDNSTLKFITTSAEEHGKVLANYVNISENGTTLDMTFNGAALGEEDSMTIRLFDQSEDEEGVEIEGKFAKLQNNARYDFTDNGDGTYTISNTKSASDVVEEVGGNVNNVSTAEAWDSIDTSKVSNNVIVAIVQKLAELSNSVNEAMQKIYKDALTAIAPEVSPMVQQTQSETANQVFGAVGTRLSGGISGGRQGMSSGDNPFERVAVWVQGLFNKSKLDDTSKSKGFDSDTYGTALGIEKMLDSHRKVGVGYAYSKTDIDGFMRDTDVKTHTAILYGEYKPSQWYVNGIATYGWSDYDENKNVAGIGVKADYDVETFGLQAMTGYDFNLNGVQLTPEAGLRYVHISQDSYKDSADQKVSGNDSDILTGVIGAKVSKNFELSNGMMLKPEAKVAATYDLLNDKVNSVVTLANGSAYSVNGKSLNRFGMEFGAGVTAEVDDNVELSLGYEGKFREDYQDHTGLVNVKYKF